jgi:hypothetical protein
VPTETAPFGLGFLAGEAEWRGILPSQLRGITQPESSQAYYLSIVYEEFRIAEDGDPALRSRLRDHVSPGRLDQPGGAGLPQPIGIELALWSSDGPRGAGVERSYANAREDT